MSKEPLKFPVAFAKQMQTMLGYDYDDFCKALNAPSPISLRLNNSKRQLHDNFPKIPWCSSGRYLYERPIFTLDPIFHGGAYYVQEASSMFLEQAFKQAVDISEPLRVLDLCAAPGGKSTHLLSLINKDSLLVSNEVIRSRANILSENIQKWGYANVIVTNNDPDHFQSLKGFFDVIVVDAPCSGEGLFRKEPDAMNEWSPENIDLCWKRQRRILSDIWPALKADGVLLYSTCTYNRLENEDNLLWAHDQLDAEFISIKTESDWGAQEVKEGKTIGYHFYPHQAKGEGFFISAIRKTSDQQAVRMKLKKKIFQAPSIEIMSQLKEWVTNAQQKHFLQWKDAVLMIPESQSEAIKFITEQLHIVSAGTIVGELKHEKIIPDHAFALSIETNTDFFNQLQLTKEQALQYLRKEVIQINPDKKGFTLVSYEGISLGWANVLDNRINNMYPPNWRIRMGGY